MKKLLVLCMAVLMLVGMMGSLPAFAEDQYEVPDVANDDSKMDNSIEKSAINKLKVKNLEGFQDLLRLREEARVLRTQIKADRVTLRALVKEARITKNQEALSEFKEGIPAIKQLQIERKALWVTQKSNWLDMKAARIAKDEVRMQEILTNDIIPTRQAINNKLIEIKSAQEQLINAMKTDNSAGEPQPEQPVPEQS